MGWMDTVRGWLGRDGADGQDPRLYDNVADGAQMTSGDADAAERANPDVGQSGGLENAPAHDSHSLWWRQEAEDREDAIPLRDEDEHHQRQIGRADRDEGMER